MTDAEDRCLWTLDRIDPYLDGDLTSDESTAFERHVAECPECRDELSLARAVVRELRSLPELECPDRVVADARGRCDAAREDAASGVRTWIRRMADRFRSGGAFALRPAMAVMIVVIVAVSVFVLTQHEQSPFNIADSGDEQITPEDVEIAKLDAMLAFAYLGKYSRRTGEILKEDVINQRVIKPLGKTIVQPIYPFPRDE